MHAREFDIHERGTRGWVECPKWTGLGWWDEGPEQG